MGWIISDKEKDLYICPNCKAGYYYCISNGAIEMITKYFPTCPKCGHDMRKNESNKSKGNY